MLYKGMYASLMCPACDVTVWVRERQHHPGLGKEPTTGIYVTLKCFGRNTKHLEHMLVLP